jgi:outer membrane lipoprotein-sorting protein
MSPVEELGRETIDGIEIRGFSGTIDGVMWKVWANPETGLPVAVEKQMNDSGLVLKLSRFEFDVAFDESLFITTAPEGYRVQKLTQEKGAVSKLPEFVPHSYTQVFELGGDVRSTTRIEHLTRSIRRQISPDGRIDVIDMSEKDLHQLTLYPDEKVAIKQTTEGFGSRKDPYCLQLLQKTRRDNAHLDLGEKTVDGRLAYGIRSESPANAYEFWIDKESNLPVQMIIHHLSSKSPRRIIFSDFDFKSPLDAALFSTEAPAGYAVKASVQEIDDHELEKPEFVQHSFRQQLELNGVIKDDKRMEYLSPSIRRQVYPSGKIEVVDMSAVDLVTLTLRPKPRNAVKEIVAGFGIHQDPYCLGMMQQAAAKKGSVDLGEKMVEGRLAHGYKTDTFEIWADKETELPLRIIIEHHNSPEPRRIIMSEFDFTSPADESLFSTDPPAGYSLKVKRK